MMGRVNAAGAWGRMIARLPTPGPSSMGYFYAPELARRLRERLRQESFDLILAHCSSVAPYVARSEEHTSELQSLMRISYAVFCLKKKTKNTQSNNQSINALNDSETNDY